FIMAMMNFDEPLFFNTWKRLLSEKSFSEVFYQVIIPLLNEIGMLWQTNTINPAHEHFISYLIRQKIHSAIEVEQAKEPVHTDKVFILFLPQGEIHEIGLMYLHYQIIQQGYKVVFLGSNIPVESLIDFNKHFDNCIFVSYFTVSPHLDDVDTYLNTLKKSVLLGNSKLWIAGRNTVNLSQSQLPENIQVFSSIENLVDRI
ncbi:MAG: MerR family transcriptional regulator, partial [Flavobacterium sp.]